MSSEQLINDIKLRRGEIVSRLRNARWKEHQQIQRELYQCEMELQQVLMSPETSGPLQKHSIY